MSNRIGLRTVKPSEVGEAIRCACRFDVMAMKPGNVSIDSPGHGMTAREFLLSAAAAASLLVQTDKGVGKCVLDATRASIAVANCNTNLGIILLAGPFAGAATLESSECDLRRRLAVVLDQLTVEDSKWVFSAIRHAIPAGLGRVAEQDLATEPTLALKEVMRLAARHDRVAYQYANDYEDIFEFGLPLLKEYCGRWDSLVWASVGVYLAMLSSYLDSHVVRKHGKRRACEVRAAARALESDFKACENPARLNDELTRFDRELKQIGVNPGTSADLTVTTVLAMLLQHL